jgi:hypothetical protein
MYFTGPMAIITPIPQLFIHYRAQIPLETGTGEAITKVWHRVAVSAQAMERLEQGLYRYPRWRRAGTLKKLVLLMRAAVLID